MDRPKKGEKERRYQKKKVAKQNFRVARYSGVHSHKYIENSGTLQLTLEDIMSTNMLVRVEDQGIEMRKQKKGRVGTEDRTQQMAARS